jgi:hypothetical protein
MAKSRVRKARKRAEKAVKAKRKYVRRQPAVTTMVASESAQDDVMLGAEFGPVVMAGTCIVCQNSLEQHFAANGRYVGCIGEKRADSSLFVPLFVPPVIISSAVLNGILQSRSGALIHTDGNGGNGARARMERRPAPARATTDRRSSRAPLLVPVKDVIGDEHGEKTQKVFTFVNQHKGDGGITLKSLVEKINLPYSTVQSQVNKLIALKAIAKRAQPKAKAAA